MFQILILSLAFAGTSFASGKTYPSNGNSMHPYFDNSKTISGTISLDKSIAQDFRFRMEDVIYVIAREAETPKGNIKGVIRIDKLLKKSFPIKFEMGPHNIMMGEPKAFKGSFSVYAKISRHGGALSKPGDILGGRQRTKLGDQGLRLTLNQIVQKESSSITVQKDSHAVPHISGEVKIGAHLQPRLLKAFEQSQDARVFVMLKKKENHRGMPLAAVAIQKVTPASFPLRFRLGPENVLVSNPFDEEYKITAKLSFSGDASDTTNIISGEISSPIKATAKNIHIELSQYQ